MQFITRLLELIVYQELDLWELPNSMVAAVRMFLGRHSSLSAYNKQVLSIFMKIASTPLNKRDEAFAGLLAKLDAREGEGSLADGLGMAVVRAWVSAKSKGNGATILQELIAQMRG